MADPRNARVGARHWCRRAPPKLATCDCRIRPGPFVVIASPAQRSGDNEGTVPMADNEATGGARPLRFGVVAPIRTDLPAWRDQVRRIADSG